MSAPRELPRSVLVAGGGQVAILAAIAVRQALPATDVTVLATPPEPAAFADRAATALPFTARLLDRLGITEPDVVLRCGGSHRLLTRYIGWGDEGQQGVAPYGAAIDPALRTAFAREWGGGPRNAATQAAPESLAEVLAAAGRFQPMPADPAHPLGEIEYALRWNAPALRDLLIAQAQALGVGHAQGVPGALALDDEGLAVTLQVAGRAPLAADLFVDCTGPAASLLAQMPGARRTDWSAILPVRQVLHAKPGQAMLALEDRITLTPAGWLHELAGRDGLQRSLGLCEGADGDAALAALGGQPAGAVAFTPGRAEQPWIGNVVALGDAAALFEPLGPYNLDLAHRQLDLLIELLPGRTMVPTERAEFNRRAALMADRARDSVAAHYAAPRAAPMFGAFERSEELALALDQFTRRGRVPFFEDSPLLVQELGALLGALGIARGAGPLAHVADAGASESFRAKANAALRNVPLYRDWLGGRLETAR